MANYDKYMMVGERLDIAKAFNSEELLSPCAVVMDGEFFTGNGLYEDRFIKEWKITVNTSSPKKSVPTGFIIRWQVAYNGEGLKTGELSIHDFETEDGEHMMSDFYSHFPTGTGLQLVNEGDDFKGLWYINSKGDYEFAGKTFTFAENTESFTITWQDDIPGDKGEIVSGFVVRTTPYVDPR